MIAYQLGYTHSMLHLSANPMSLRLIKNSLLLRRMAYCVASLFSLWWSHGSVCALFTEICAMNKWDSSWLMALFPGTGLMKRDSTNIIKQKPKACNEIGWLTVKINICLSSHVQIILIKQLMNSWPSFKFKSSSRSPTPCSSVTATPCYFRIRSVQRIVAWMAPMTLACIA